jgi:hypothetical protein
MLYAFPHVYFYLEKLVINCSFHSRAHCEKLLRFMLLLFRDFFGLIVFLWEGIILKDLLNLPLLGKTG